MLATYGKINVSPDWSGDRPVYCNAFRIRRILLPSGTIRTITIVADLRKVVNMTKFELTLSVRDLAVLQMALYDYRSNKECIYRFYRENPSELPITPLEALSDDLASLDHLIDVFSYTGKRYCESD